MISIVMPSYNQASFIEQSIDSVLTQENVSVELIIADGSSTDSTLKILNRKSLEHPNLKFESSPDTGPAQAINRALDRSRGTIIGWLNSDDLYAENILYDVAKYFEQNPDKILVYGHGAFIDETGKKTQAYPTMRPEAGLESFQTGCFICQPTVFFKRSLMTIQGKLDETFKASFDYEYWVRAFTNFPGRIGFLDQQLAQSRLHADTITHQQRAVVAAEGARICAHYFGQAPIHWMVTYIEEMEIKHARKFDTFSQAEKNTIYSTFEPLCAPEDIRLIKDMN